MTRSALPIALAAALFGLAACETADQTAEKETIHWNTPGQTPTSPPPEAAPPPPPPASPQAAKPADEPECREYQTTVMIDGKPQKAYGKACRQPDGTWKEQGVHAGGPQAKAEQSFPYGWHGYSFPSGPRYGPGGMSIGVGAGSGGGWMGYGVGF